MRENLQVSIAAAAKRGEALDHVLLYGPPGLGKTTLAYVIANELGVPIRTTAGPVIEKPGDLAGILSNLQPREVLFIDEIHRMAPAIEEILYPAMEDFELDIVIGQGPGRAIGEGAGREVHAGRRDDARRAADLAAARALRHRPPAGFLHRRATSRRSSGARRASSTCRSTTMRRARLAGRARGTPRIANRLLRRVRDYAQVRADGHITVDVARAALALLEVDAHGFDESRSPADADDHRQVQRRAGRPQQPGGGDSAKRPTPSKTCTSRI